MGDRAAKWVIRQLEARGHEAVLVDAAELKLPLLDKMWKELKDDTSSGNAALREKLLPLSQLYARTDGYVVVSAEYNHSAPPALTNLIDYFLDEYFFRPSAIVCYSVSPYGGVRAAMQLRDAASGSWSAYDSVVTAHPFDRQCAERGRCRTDAGVGREIRQVFR